MNKNLTVNMGNCNHRRYIPRLIEMVQAGRIDPAKILTQVKPMTDAIEAFKAFDRRDSGWIKVELQPARQSADNGTEERVHGSAVLDRAIAEADPLGEARSKKPGSL